MRLRISPGAPHGRILLSVATVVWIAWCVSPTSRGWCDENRTLDWLKEAEAGWQRIRSRPLPLYWIHRSRSLDSARRTEKDRLRLCFPKAADVSSNYVAFLMSASDLSKSELDALDALTPARAKELATIVAARNERYAFSIRRPNPRLAWGVRLVEPRAGDTRRLTLDFDRARPTLQLFTFARRMTVAQALKSNYCRLLSAKYVEEKGKRLFRVEIESDGLESVTKGMTWVPEGRHTVFLAPENDWMIVRTVYVDSQGFVETTECEVDQETGLLRRFRGWVVYVTPDGKELPEGGIDDTFTYVFESAERAPESSFYLTGYGIPEPAEFRRSTGWIWGLVAAGVLLVLCGVWLVRRASRTPSAR